MSSADFQVLHEVCLQGLIMKAIMLGLAVQLTIVDVEVMYLSPYGTAYRDTACFASDVLEASYVVSTSGGIACCGDGGKNRSLNSHLPTLLCRPEDAVQRVLPAPMRLAEVCCRGSSSSSTMMVAGLH